MVLLGAAEVLKPGTIVRMLKKAKLGDLAPAVTSVEDFALAAEDLGL